MSVQSHLDQLEAKHAELERTILIESTRPLPDFALVTQLKKQKLRLKEHMAFLYREVSHVSAVA